MSPDDYGSKEGPWGQRPQQVDEILSKIRDSFKGRFPIGWIILVVLAFLWGITSIYTIQPSEVGVVQRFGRYIRTTDPGIHLKLPKGIEQVRKVAIEKVETEDFGIRTLRPGIRTQYSPSRAYLRESMMLTGDLNVAIVPWIVQYKIKDAYEYLFKVRAVRETLRDLSEAIMRQVVGDRSVNEVINKRKEIADAAKVDLQAALDEAETGIRVINVELKTTTVPEPVQPSWNEVNQAIQEKEKLIYQAKEQYNRAIPAARGDAEKLIRESEGYAMKRVNRSKGDASRFLAVYEEYSKAKDVTRRRLYLEAMKDVFPKLGPLYIVDEEQKGLLPLLDLGRLGGEK
jgi:membrane protease subunit HflK